MAAGAFSAGAALGWSDPRRFRSRRRRATSRTQRFPAPKRINSL
jgi:hypothetical protein